MATDVIVVGAGPAGSATALLLARRGYRVSIVDRARFPRPKPCGEYVNPDAAARLDALGVGPAIGAAGTTLSGVRIVGRDGCAVWAPFPAGRALLVSRIHLDHTLVCAAARAGAQVIEEFRVEGTTPGPEPAVAGRHRGRTIRMSARLVIGADGLRSVVARRAGPLEAAVDGHYTIGAHFEILEAPVPGLSLHLGHGWFAGAAVYGAGTGNIVAAVARSALRQARGNVEALFSNACEQLPVLRALVRRARRVTPFVSVGPLGYTRRRAVDSGLLLVGDAAGTINPMTGEGIAMALRSAEMAAAAADEVLRGGTASRQALDRYERARIDAFKERWTVSRALQWILRRPALASSLLARMAADPRLATVLLGVVGDGRPTRDIASAGFLARLIRPRV